MEGAIGQSRRIAALAGLLWVAAVAAMVADGAWLAEQNRLAFEALPPPPLGQYVYPTVAETIAWFARALLFTGLATLAAWVVLAWIGRRSRVAFRLLVAAAGLGAFATVTLAGRGHAFLLDPVYQSLGVPWAQTLVGTPAVEELVLAGTSAIVLVLVHAGRTREGIAIGAAVGLGFTIAETAHYQVLDFLDEGSRYWATLLTRFALLGLGIHSVKAAISGGAIAWWLGGARTARRAAVPGAAILGAMALHALWNATASNTMSEMLAVLQPGEINPSPVALSLVAWTFSGVMLAVPIVLLAIAWRRNGPAPSRTEPVPAPEPSLAAPLPPPA